MDAGIESAATATGITTADPRFAWPGLIPGATGLHRRYGQSRQDFRDQLLAVAFVLFGLSRLGLNDLPGTFKWRSKSGNTTDYPPIGLMLVVRVVGTILLNLLFGR